MLVLIENFNPKWTLKHLENIQLNSEAYGIYFSDEQMNEQKIKIKIGNADNRISREMKCYEIYDNDIYIGDITINFHDEKPEIDIMIFSEYQKKGYAKKALMEFINTKSIESNEIEGTVRHNNPNKLIIKKIFGDIGFKYKYSSNAVEVYSFQR